MTMIHLHSGLKRNISVTEDGATANHLSLQFVTILSPGRICIAAHLGLPPNYHRQKHAKVAIAFIAADIHL